MNWNYKQRCGLSNNSSITCMIDVFFLITDHHVLTISLQINKNNKTYQNRLTRWIDRLLPSEFETKHLSGTKMSVIDYTLRHPIGKAQPPSNENSVVALLENFIACPNFKTALCQI